MYENLDAKKIINLLFWRRLGHKGLISDVEFENILSSLIVHGLNHIHEPHTVVELAKLKAYLVVFYYLSGPCLEYRLYEQIKVGLKKLHAAPSDTMPDSSRPIIYVYNTELRQIIPVARRAQQEMPNDDSLIQEAIVVRGSRLEY